MFLFSVPCVCDPNISWFCIISRPKQAKFRTLTVKNVIFRCFLIFKKKERKKRKISSILSNQKILRAKSEFSAPQDSQQCRKFHLKHLTLHLEKAHHLSSSSTSTMWSSWSYWHFTGMTDDNQVSLFSCWFNVSTKHHHHFHLEKRCIIIPEEDDPGSESSVASISSERWTERLKVMTVWHNSTNHSGSHKSAFPRITDSLQADIKLQTFLSNFFFFF